MAVVWPSKNNFANGDVLTASNMNNIADTLNVFNPTSATSGQVWQADGAGSGSYQTGNFPSFTQLASVSLSNVSTGTTSTLNFSGYRLAYISYFAADGAGDNSGIQMRFNGDTGSTYTYAIAWDSSQQGAEDTTFIRLSANYYSSVSGGIWIDVRQGEGMFRTCSFWAYTTRRTLADDRPWSTFGTGAHESTANLTTITLFKPSGTWATNTNNKFIVYGVK